MSTYTITLSFGEILALQAGLLYLIEQGERQAKDFPTRISHDKIRYERVLRRLAEVAGELPNLGPDSDSGNA